MNRMALAALATAQFVMVLDQSVMNVSISQLVADFDTTVTTIQAVITLYCLVMAMFMLTGAKIGDIIGRRRAFAIGLVIYGCGSAMTAAAQSVAVLTLGWSVLEGLGAALVLPAGTWGWVKPKDSPIEPFGLSLTLFVIAAGAASLWGFVHWQRYREAEGRDPLVHLDLMKIPPLRAGLMSLFSQNLILMGIF